MATWNPENIDPQKVNEVLLRLAYGRVRDSHLNWTPQQCLAATEELIKQGVAVAIDGEGRLMLDSSPAKVLVASRIAPRLFPPVEGDSDEARNARAYQHEQRVLDETRPRLRPRSEIEAELAALDGTDEESKCRRALLREQLIIMGGADA
jgi:hypothetical protein